MKRTRPLFTADPGWLFLLAGLGLFMAVIVIPANRDAHALREQLEELRAEERYAYDRLRAYSAFLDEMDAPDPAMLQRLAATQLNMIPRGDKPVIISTSQVETVTGWVDSSVRFEPYEPQELPETALSDLAEGPYRIWLLAGAALCMFMGLLLTPGLAPAQVKTARKRQQRTRRGLATVVMAESAAELAYDTTDESPGRTWADVSDSSDALDFDLDDAEDESQFEQQHDFGWVSEPNDPQSMDDDSDPEVVPRRGRVQNSQLLEQIDEPLLPYPMPPQPGVIESKPGKSNPKLGLDELKAMIRNQAVAEQTAAVTPEVPVELEELAKRKTTSGKKRSKETSSERTHAPSGDDRCAESFTEGASSEEVDVDERVEAEPPLDSEAVTAETSKPGSAALDPAEDWEDEDDEDFDEEEEDLEDDDEEIEDDVDADDDEDDEDVEYEYYDEDGNLIDPDDLDDDEWEFFDEEEEEEDDDSAEDEEEDEDEDEDEEDE